MPVMGNMAVVAQGLTWLQLRLLLRLPQLPKKYAAVQGVQQQPTPDEGGVEGGGGGEGEEEGGVEGGGDGGGGVIWPFKNEEKPLTPPPKTWSVTGLTSSSINPHKKILVFKFGVSVCGGVWVTKKNKIKRKRKRKEKGKRDPFPPGFLPQVGTKTPSLIWGRFQLRMWE